MFTPKNCLAYWLESLKILLMKMFVGKSTKLKQAAVGHAIMKAVRPRAVIAPHFKYVLVCNNVPDFS